MNPSQNNEEKRNYPRLPAEIPVEVNELSYPLPTEWGGSGTGKDISGGGIAFISNVRYTPETVLSMKVMIKGLQGYKKPHSVLLDVSDEPFLTVIGKVVWCRPAQTGSAYEMGVQFLDVYEDDHRALIKYLNDLL